MEKTRAKSIPCPLGGDCWSPSCSLSRCAEQLAQRAEQLAQEQFEKKHKDFIDYRTEDIGLSRESVVRRTREVALRRSGRRR